MAEDPMNNSLRPRYESRDASAKTLWLFGAGILISIGMVLAFLWFQYRAVMGVSPTARETDASAWSYAARELKGIQQERSELQSEETERLESYRWIEPASNTARIPLERAMRIAADQGLPYWGEKNPQLKPIDMINEKARTND